MSWTPWALPGVAVFVCGIALALFIYRARPDRSQNRRLAAQLTLEAVVVGLLGGSTWLLTNPRAVALLGLTAYVLVWPKLWTYYSFLATLDSPLARPLQSRRRLNLLLLCTLLAATSVLLRPEWYGGAVEYWPEVRGLDMQSGTAFVPIFWMWALMWLVGLSFSISALRSARTALRREQGRAFLIAFGTRDISFLFFTAALTFVPATYAHYNWLFMVFPTIWLVYFPLVTYGILKHQLFDIQLKVKHGMERSVMAAAIAIAFFVGSQAAERLVPVNNFILGLLAAALVTAVFNPLQRLAQRLADRVMPGVATTEAYLTERKHEVYRDAVEGASQDGIITERERAILTRLQQSLAISPFEARQIEREVEAVFARAPVAAFAGAI